MAKPIQPDRPIWPPFPDEPSVVDPVSEDRLPSNEHAPRLPLPDRVSAESIESIEPVRLT